MHPALSNGSYDVNRIREDFPILAMQVYGKPLVYLDNAASSQKPKAVIEALKHYYENDHANVHRGVHSLSERATELYEEARIKVQRFLNAPCLRELIFTRGTTEAINLIAQTFGRMNVHAGDEVIVTALEHHSNIVPWQLLAQRTGAELQFLLDGISQNLGPGLLRVKGLVNVAGEPGRPAVIQGAQHLLHTMTWLDRWPDKDERTRVVFITHGIPHDSLRDVIELLDRMSARTFKAREKAKASREGS